MATYTQAGRSLLLQTPLGKDVLLIKRLQGREAVSTLFTFTLDLLAARDSEIPFEGIIAQNVTVETILPDSTKRYFNGIVSRFSEGGRDEDFLYLHAHVVPTVWLLTKVVRSRVFQHITVPDILRDVFTGYQVQYDFIGIYRERDYCVQYRESDFDFVSRLMEEEGIYYYFMHSDGAHRMIVTDKTMLHPMIEGQSEIIYDEVEGGDRNEQIRIYKWMKTQELRSGKLTLWDHCFELPGKNLEADVHSVKSVTVGTVPHELHRGNENLEIYDYPGGYAQRFDGIEKSGAPQPQNLQYIFEDRTRTVRIRMEQEDVQALEMDGESCCANFTAGHEFKLKRHFNANGAYMLTSVEHDAVQGDYRSDQQEDFDYKNRFTAIPHALKYRPRRVTAKPVIAGVQTATVVGPPGEEIFVDQYGRVKVQFHWDREGLRNAESSCWLRVSQVWAGDGWGSFFWPRIGHEVVVTFEEGDPDQPLIIGSVYNAKNMPWFKLPTNRQLGGIKSASERGSAHQNYNGFVFNDEKGQEHLSIHSERNLSLNSEGDKMIHSGRHKGERVGIANMMTVGKLIPGGGGSGGGEFSEGDPWMHPQPMGFLGMNTAITYGDAFQVATPLNNQLAVGNNFQLCINPFGLAAGVEGAAIPDFIKSLLGGGMGGSMQFTMGTNAQFTLGQTYEISIGPPKIEIHQGYDQHYAVNTLCAILAGLAVVYVIGYGLIPTYTGSDTEAKATKQHNEQSGDRTRGIVTLAYQLVADLGLSVILGVECGIDHVDWIADDLMKTLYKVDSTVLALYSAPDANAAAAKAGTPGWWANWGSQTFGCIGALAVGAAELLIPAVEDGLTNKE